MKTKSYRLEDLKTVKICIGYVGENKRTQVRIDCTSAFEEYPGATPALSVRPPRGGIYPAVIEQDGNIVVWTVTNSDLLFKGDGEIQFSFILGDVVKKTEVGKYEVHRSIITTANVPDPVAEWLIRATAAAAAAEAAAQHQPKIEDEYWYVWDADAEEYVSTGIKAKGDKGDPGTPGDPTQLIDDATPANNKTFSSSKVNTELTGVLNAINQKIEKPATAGTSGQVLVSDGNGGQVWGTTGQGTIVVDDTFSVSGAAADSKKVGDLKSAFNEEFTYPTLTSSDIVSGKYINSSTGYEVGSATYVCTGFIEIPSTSKGLLLQSNCFFGSVVGCCFYDSSKNLVSGISDSNLWNTKRIAEKIPSNAVYFRATLQAANYSSPSDFGICYQDIANALTGTVATINASITSANNHSDELHGISTNSVEALETEKNSVKDGFALGQTSDGATFLESTYRMINSTPFIASINTMFTTDWNNFVVYPWKYSSNAWSGLGWKSQDFQIDANAVYKFVIGRSNYSTTALTSDEQAAVNNNTKIYSNLWKTIGGIRNRVAALTRVMNRQGEGYGYPENSIPAIQAALNDGYKMIRVSVAVTNDDKFYCTHVYELENNSTYKYVKINGETYTEDIDINSSTSTFIDSLTYKGYAIPTLDAVMSEMVKHQMDSITWELKGTFTDSQLHALVKKSYYYNMPVVFSAGYLDIDQLTTLYTDLNIAVIFNYTDSLGSGFKTRYENKYKTMRYDCYWGDTVSEEQVSTVIHKDNVTLKFGAGTIPNASTILSNYVKWVDVSEVNYPLSYFV